MARAEAVEWVDGNDSASPVRRFGVETGRPVRAPHYLEAKILFIKRKHPLVFVERPTPRVKAIGGLFSGA